MSIDGICRSCLVKISNNSESHVYSEKNRRLFIYSTGIQVKQDDVFVFQLCQNCYNNMKVACKFKKCCRTSEKKFRNYLYSKEYEDNIDFYSYIQNNGNSLSLRWPKQYQNSTPNHNRHKDIENGSTTTSIRNFLKDFLQGDEIPDSEARIINEVIREEADISDESLDSHWLQDDVSMNNDFSLDFRLSPFSTARSVINDHSYTLPVEYQNDVRYEKSHQTIHTTNEEKQVVNINQAETRCVIDKNLDKALLDESVEKFALEDILTTPPINPNVWAPSTPTINNILFGEKLDDDLHKPGQNIEQYEVVVGTDNSDEFLTFNNISEKEKNTENLINQNEEIITEEINQEVESNENSNTEDDTSSHETISSDSNLKSSKFVEVNDIDNKIVIKIKKEPQVNSDKNQNRTDEHDNIEKLQNNVKKTTNHKRPGKNLKKIYDYTLDKNVEDESNDDVFKKPLTPIENLYCIENIKCLLCNREFKTTAYLKIHMTRKHNVLVNVPYKKPKTKRICDHCGRTFTSTLYNFIKHIKSHTEKPHYCKKCNLCFESKSRLAMHERSHSGVPRVPVTKDLKKFVCEHCGGSFTWSNYGTHLRRHTKDYSFRCAQCDAGFYRRSDYDYHIRTHTGERPLSCNFCPRTFKRRDVLNIHIRTHTGERPFKCNICNKTFTTAVNMRTHQSRAQECLILQEQLAFPGDKEFVAIE